MTRLFGLLPSRPPFSDWLAQVERKVSRVQGGNAAATPETVILLRAYYDAGVSANEAALDLLS